jgi:hypothetical protein
MSRRSKVSLAAVLILAAVVLAAFMAYLLRQGLDRASLWATYLGLPVTVITGSAGVWAAVLAAKALHGAENMLEADQGGSSGGVRPSISGSGGIRQSNTGGITIAQIGSGDIDVTGQPTQEPPHERQ